jgi:hypothetical protein
VSDHIHATDIAVWFGRWLNWQKYLLWNFTCLFIDRKPVKQRALRCEIVGGTLLEAALIGFAVLIAALARDWFGLANALSMASLIMVWATIIHYNHTSLDRVLEKIPDGKRTWDMKKELLQSPIERPCYSLHLSGSPRKAF